MKWAISEGVVSLMALMLGSYFSFDFFMRLLSGEKAQLCWGYQPPCLGDELFYGLSMLIGGILGLLHVYYLYVKGNSI